MPRAFIHFIFFLISCSTLLSLDTQLLAQNKTHPYLRPSIGLSQYDGDFGSSIFKFTQPQGTHFGLGIGKKLTPTIHANLSLDWNFIRFDAHPQDRIPSRGLTYFRTHLLQLSPSIEIHDYHKKLFPYLPFHFFAEVGGFFSSAFQLNNRYDFFTGLSSGLGLSIPIKKDRKLLLGTTYHWLLFNASKDQLEGALTQNAVLSNFDFADQDEFLNIYAAIQWPLKVNKKESSLSQIDRDSDGILNEADYCPDRAGPASTNGCPDNDFDGVANDIDYCPDVVGSVSANGCPDSDHDGVIDLYDLCPHIAAKAPNGCMDDSGQQATPLVDSDLDLTPDTIDACPNTFGLPSLSGCDSLSVYFDLNSTKISTTDSLRLMRLANDINEFHANTTLTITILGYTDTIGETTYNLELSEKRATSVKDLLLSFLKENVMLDTQGKGKTKEFPTLALNRYALIRIKDVDTN